ncbi:hypothetical protein DOTSEDRAFT_53220 [Dothistroma septosporum NZE10]|uniref:BAH domain-containing protein n=1 Tax=Dothistroma septosporum (strain NZE10 / CBS 128990) TaxID=675120 RepID=N1PNI6_DOTSN|nr:hypothetical protein DOTSEDRAFT_53220 [Dothistroma septosporum NZE10]
MRQKPAVDKATSKTNGHQAPSAKRFQAAPSSTKQPAQPETLGEDDREKLAHFLDAGNPFTVRIAKHPATNAKKRKRDEDGLLQDDLFDDRLTCLYAVQPLDKWESLRRYKKFTVGTESIATGQCVLIKQDDSEEAILDLTAQWKAKVLEVRALDQEHVFIRVAWLNRPEDLENGRQDYHGANELIPTNRMDVIDAMSVNGSFEIVKWDDSDNDTAVVNEEQYFWRQTLDFIDNRISKLRLMCKDNTPQNPDEMIVQCSHEGCRKWQHVKCMAEFALQDAANEKPPSSSKRKGAIKKQEPQNEDQKNLNIRQDSPVVAKAVKGSVTAEVFIKGEPRHAEVNPATQTEIIITDAKGEQHPVALNCLLCGKPVD